MIASTASVPTPLPPRPGSPAIWANEPLVHGEFSFKGREISGDYAGYEILPPNESGGVPAGGATGVKAFTKLSATGFKQAVDAAAALAAERKLSDTMTSPAIALLQAGDGAYYVTLLLAPRPASLLTIDGTADLIIKDVSKPHRDLKAVVGANSIVNFTDEPIEPDPAKPDPPKPDPPKPDPPKPDPPKPDPPKPDPPKPDPPKPDPPKPDPPKPS